MKMILSPAKNLRTLELPGAVTSLPVFGAKTAELAHILKAMTEDDFKAAMQLSDQLTALNRERCAAFRLDTDGTPALLAYDGQQYRALAAETFTTEDWEFANTHLRILDALYGVLKPLDSIYPYRLEMKNKILKEQSLYAFWGDRLYRELTADGDMPIVNLASAEYGRAVEKHLKNPEEMVTCTFKVMKNGVPKTHSTQSKQARGLMAGWIIRRRAADIETLRAFDEDGYRLDETLSSDGELVFVKS
ncbi:peroxide stress protein YaaA [Eubacterium sp. 1001713B170207_170306_E7]|uniref:peroxide stress protein YaaA n=1 Tax=Eubacterium sp. 1001713B170207_170306_E7 TaxID=2787097 RepID=UPI001899ED91|nr:peroxide stress protein YaaA [Eubacterium sp. 1001713B170207_170306_E7]